MDRAEVASLVNDFFINVGKMTTGSSSACLHVITDDKESQTEFNVNPPNVERYTDENPMDQFKLFEGSEQEVLKLVKDINVSKSSGLDNVSSFIIKEVFQILIPEVTHMFNLSIRTSIFPEAWKRALVIPIPKSVNLTNVKN